MSAPPSAAQWTAVVATHLPPLSRPQATAPATMTVIILADRGRYARWLFQAIVHLGWHPLLRVTAGGLFRPQGKAR